MDIEGAANKDIREEQMGVKKEMANLSVLRWAHKSSLFYLQFGLACCVMEMLSTGASRFDLDRFGMIPRGSPRQADIIIVAGTLTWKMAPMLKRLYDQMAEPKYVIAMEGTNDVSREHTPAEVYPYLLLMIDNARKNAEVEDVRMMLATIIPRLDGRNPQTEAMNNEAIIPAQQAKKNVKFCDPWTAYWSYGDWQSLMWDEKHPNQTESYCF